MRASRPVIWLALLIAVLAVVATCFGLFWPGGPGEFTHTPTRGEAVDIYGHGIYAFDTDFRAAGNRGTDAVSLVLGVPLLVAFTVLYRRDSVRGGLLLLGLLGYFLYVYASVALATSYNNLFLLYIALFAASLFGFVYCFGSLHEVAPRAFSGPLPRRSVAGFLFLSGAVTAAIWLMPLITALSNGSPPDTLEHYATIVTDVLDLGVIVPALFLSGVLVLRTRPLGYLIALPLLVLVAMLLPAISMQTVFQLRAGLELSPGEIIGPIAGFLVLGIIAVWILVVVLRRCPCAGRSSTAVKPRGS